MPSGRNERELQNLLATQESIFGLCNLQIQRDGVDLIARVRFPMFKKKSVELTTEHRFENGFAQTQSAIRRWIEDVVAVDAIILAHAQVTRLGMHWPNELPVPLYQVKAAN